MTASPSQSLAAHCLVFALLIPSLVVAGLHREAPLVRQAHKTEYPTVSSHSICTQMTAMKRRDT